MIRTPDSWWQLGAADSVRDLELPIPARHAFLYVGVNRLEEIPDLDLDRLAGQPRVGARTKERLALLLEVMRLRFRTPSPDRTAFEATLPRNRPSAWRTARKQDRLESLCLSRPARRALSAVGAATAGDVLDFTMAELRAQRGFGPKTRYELEDLLAVLYHRFSGVSSPRAESVDAYFDRILPYRPAGHRNNEQAVIERLLGLHPGERQPLAAWPTHAGVAADLGISGTRVQQVVAKTRRRWAHPALRKLRLDLLTIIERRGGVLTPAELADGMLDLRGSAARPEVRRRRARAVVRAGVEGEAATSPRFRAYRRARVIFVALADRRGAPVRRLAACANELRQRV